MQNVKANSNGHVHPSQLAVDLRYQTTRESIRYYTNWDHTPEKKKKKTTWGCRPKYGTPNIHKVSTKVNEQRWFLEVHIFWDRAALQWLIVCLCFLHYYRVFMLEKSENQMSELNTLKMAITNMLMFNAILNLTWDKIKHKNHPSFWVYTKYPTKIIKHP